MKRSYLAIELGRESLESIGRWQKQLERGTKAECLPRHHLQLLLDDLGECPVEALEAAQLAAARIASRYSPFSVYLDAVSAYPSLDSPRLVHAVATDGKGRLRRIREALHEALVDFGFPVPPGAWQPHVPLARLPKGGSLPADMLDARFGEVRVGGLSVFQKDPCGRFRRHAQAPLPRLVEPDLEEDDAQQRAEIRQLLDGRLARRGPQIRHRPRRKPIEGVTIDEEAGEDE